MRGFESLVYLEDNPIEEIGVDTLGEGISCLRGLSKGNIGLRIFLDYNLTSAAFKGVT